MAGEIQVISGHFVNVLISSTISSFGSEKRFQKDLTIGQLKGKLELQTGAQSGSMVLEVYNKENKLVCKLDNDDALLGSFPIDDGMRIHVIDKSGSVGQYEDVSKVEKFEMRSEDYEKRTDSVRAFKERNKMGRFDPELQKKKAEEEEKRKAEEEAAFAKISVGDRCEVKTGCCQPTRRGQVMYVGKTEFKEGLWVGVKYDEPFGKNDGTVQGKRYFECQDKYGGFVKPTNVTVGDFPEEDLFDDDDMEM